ncbi:hypothetical protein PENSPDRAFT_731848 [Peniophora sp. CONT]|nr:hypothetical protein PENSPDRAFT_731848 [Peniophora sp. CONT]
MDDNTVAFDFTRLPRELAVLILSKLDLRDLLAATETSRYLRQLIRNTPLLQYPIELIACGMRDNPQSGNSMAERLDNLRRHDQAWRSMSWSNTVRIRVPSEGRVESKQGVMLVTKETVHPERGVEVQQLPSSTRDIPRQVWTIKPGSDEEYDGEREVYEVDASQDLLIIRHGTTPVNTIFNVYTLSDGLPHPHAALKSFRISNTGTEGGLSGSTAGAFIRREWVYLLDQSFEIYNWKTGERNGNYDWRGTLTHFAFVSDRFLAVVVVGIPPSPAVLRIHELPSSDPAVPVTYPPTIAALAFFLPEIANALNADTEWELVGGSAQSAAQSGRLSGGDFASDRDETLILIPFRVEDRAYELIVATSRLLEFLPHPGDLSVGPGTFSLRDVPWSEWGPQCAHVHATTLNDDALDQIQASLFGSRHVQSHPVRQASGENVVRVDDYQTSRVRRAEAAHDPAQTVHHGEAALGEWFESDELQTDLPYVETDMELPESWQDKRPEDVNVSINEDGITLMDRSNSEEHGEAHTF